MQEHEIVKALAADMQNELAAKAAARPEGESGMEPVLARALVHLFEGVADDGELGGLLEAMQPAAPSAGQTRWVRKLREMTSIFLDSDSGSEEGFDGEPGSEEWRRLREFLRTDAAPAAVTIQLQKFAEGWPGWGGGSDEEDCGSDEEGMDGAMLAAAAKCLEVLQDPAAMELLNQAADGPGGQDAVADLLASLVQANERTAAAGGSREEIAPACEPEPGPPVPSTFVAPSGGFSLGSPGAPQAAATAPNRAGRTRKARRGKKKK
jgi:hypothetical protein